MQRIIVKNFGPLKDIDLKIKDYMIFLGPQASGKSTLAKLIYFFREIEFSLILFLVKESDNIVNQDYVDKKLNEIVNSRFNQLFGDYSFSERISINFHYGYSNLLNIISISFNEENSIFITKFDFQHLTKVLNEEKPVRDSLFRILSVLNNRTNSTYFIPSNRAFIAKNYSPASTDVLSKEFYDLVGDIKNNFRKDYLAQIEEKKYFNGEIENLTSIEYCLKLIKSVFKGSFSVDKNEDKITSIDGHKINLRSAASGQQESIWVMNIIFHLLLENRDIKIIVEEPEAHLFPEAQKDITYLISLLANQEGNQVIITSHSHYILGALNILINAHRIGQTNPEEVEKIVPKELWVDKNRIFAGFLENGIIKDIYDDEAEMIKIQQLNAVAGEINKDFDRLLDLEFANENV
jgi:predicted ATPase